MSEYHLVDIKFKDENILIKSLQDSGYKPVIHQEGVQLNNNYSKSKPTAHIVVPRNQFEGYGDIGFERNKKGFIMHADDYDWGKNGQKFKLNKVKIAYTENKIKKYVSGTSKCNISSRKENAKGQVEIQLRIQ
jgi:hypothetical protein